MGTVIVLPVRSSVMVMVSGTLHVPFLLVEGGPVVRVDLRLFGAFSPRAG